MEAGRGLPEWGNRRFRRFWADLWACYRTQDCQNRLEITKATVQARSDKPSTAKDTKKAARRPVGAWRASHATLWGSWCAGGAHDLGQEIQERPCGRRARRCAKRRQPQSQTSKPLNFQTSLSFQTSLGVCRIGGVLVSYKGYGVGKKETIDEAVADCDERAQRGGQEYVVRFVAPGVSGDHLFRVVHDASATVHGNRYGTPAGPVREAFAEGQSVLMDIDVVGAESVRRFVAGLPEDDPLRAGFVDIFIEPPSLDELRKRLVGRGEDSPESIQVRLANAQGELDRAHEFTYRVVNDDLQVAYRRLRDILLVKGGEL